MAFDVEAGRRYLASLPEFRPAKPLAEYSPATIERKARYFQAQQAAGHAISVRGSRGHRVTPEHPNRKVYRPPAGAGLVKSKYAPAEHPGEKPKNILPLRTHKRPQNVPERQEFAGGAVATSHQESAETVKMLEFYEGLDWRVVLTGYDCDNNVYRSIGVNAGHIRGWTVDDLLNQWRESGKSFDDWFISLANATDSDPSQSAWRMSHVCFWQIYAYPTDRHLRAFG